MSIMIMSRLFRMNLGGCNRKLLAVRLADFADDEGRGIYPGVKRLASETELSERTIQRILSDFVSEGILIVVKEATGRPGQTTRYDFDLDRLFAYSPGKTGDTVSPVGRTATGDNKAERGDTDDGDGCHGVTRTVIEPPIEPSMKREARERELSGSKDEKKSALRDFKRWYPTWPTYVDDSEPKALKAWMELSPDERHHAAERTEAYLAAVKASRRNYVCAAQVYLSEKRWLKLDTIEATKAPAAAPVARDGKIVVPVFGPVWGVARMLPLLDGPVAIDLPEDPRHSAQQMYEALARTSTSRAAAFVQRLGISVGEHGQLFFPDDFEEADRRRRILADGYPEVKRLHEAARDRNNVSVPAVVERLKELCEAVPLGSATWDAWRDHHEQMGWPFVPAPAAMKVVYFPKGGPDGLEEFERAARSLLAARDHDDAA
nr:helix-turn-helix domain-containing protein [Rhizobium sp. Q54]